ncbi:hypothetical protein SAMD00019534_105010 [Acytostelium subglobosum LB1]|uniref:hypothetical protein n=1 Tax=Acytostelium subglobosum LB1 TaxID=1410327 RepID=UPI000644A842|nr:hypothetical protein SAMD00019534_105010 [Acytostelium subglobosum LB1]GAM27326.1 hypothetical protein SAMD00019534_105010 [Acytostelium subglobosum LB1]|eukprot:XP_012749793.1 hypothetical protein SAMD00019534_105010 [Acytostelium subglobosum LB1]
MFKRSSNRYSTPIGSYISLPRGGYIVKSRLGNIQFGVPPETIKDSMAMKLDVPTIYVFPEDLWDRRTGINAAEAEFPAYFNFFILKRKVLFVCTPEQEKRIRIVFQETLLGPVDFNQNKDHHLNHDFLQEFHSTYPKEEIPDIERECKYLRTFQSVDELFDFALFDEAGVARLPQQVEVHYKMEEGTFQVVNKARNDGEQDEIVSCLPSKIAFPDPIHSISASNDVFEPPTFGITIIGSSHGFDPKKSTTGFVLWVNKRGIMVDPPLHSSSFLQSQGVPTRRVDYIILTHCHADHDSGTFQKLLEEYQITVVTTPTILNSFLRKYSALSNLSQDMLRRLFIFRPVIIGEPMNIAGAELKFFYTIHTIPTISFEVFFGGKSIYYSGDTCFDPTRIKEMNCKNIMNSTRMNFFLKPWNHTIVLHEAGVPPIHTPVTVLASLPCEIKTRLYLVHISEQSLPADSGLKIAHEGVRHTLRLDVEKHMHSEAVDILKLMESVDIFRSIPLSQAAEILRTATRKTYPQGSVIIAQDSEPDAFFVVASGIVKVSVGDLEKNLIAGDYFGEMSLIMGGRRSAKVSAVTDVGVLVFSKEDFLSITRNSTESINFVTKLWEMRNEKSWETINLNSVLSRCTNSQKTALQSILHRDQINENECLWKQGDTAEYGCLVADGSFIFKEQDSLESFTNGSFLGDVNAMTNEPPLVHRTTVIAQKNSVIYKVYSSDLNKYFQHNPGLHMAFLDTLFIDAIRDQPMNLLLNGKLTY